MYIYKDCNEYGGIEYLITSSNNTHLNAVMVVSLLAVQLKSKQGSQQDMVIKSMEKTGYSTWVNFPST